MTDENKSKGLANVDWRLLVIKMVVVTAIICFFTDWLIFDGDLLITRFMWPVAFLVAVWEAIRQSMQWRGPIEAIFTGSTSVKKVNWVQVVSHAAGYALALSLTFSVAANSVFIFGFCFPVIFVMYLFWEAYKATNGASDTVVEKGLKEVGSFIYETVFGGSGKLRDKDDVLQSTENKTRVAEVAKQQQDGIFIGRSKGMDPNAEPEKRFVSQSDRACVIGPPGTGKTTFLVNQIYHWLETGNSFLCLDIKPEIHDITKERLRAAGYTVYVYNPTTLKDKYNFLDDLESPESIGELASSFIPAESADNAVFTESARDFLDAIIAHLKAPTKKNPEPRPTLPDVYDFVVSFDNMGALLNTLGHSNSDQSRAIAKGLKIMADNERLLGSVFASFVSRMRFLRYETIRESLGKDGFSLSVFNEKKVAVFLQFEEAQKQTTAHFFSVMVGHILRYLIVHNERTPVFLLLDEIGNAGVVNDLTGKLNTIRSRKLPTWLYWQSTEQMQKYGEKADEGANIIMGACDLQMCFRLNDNATAQWMSEKIGTQEVTMRADTVGNQWFEGSVTTSVALESIIEPHKLQQLADGEAVYSYRGVHWLGEPTPYYKEN